MEMAEMASGGAGARCDAVIGDRETTGFVSSSRDTARWVTSASDRFPWMGKSMDHPEGVLGLLAKPYRRQSWQVIL